MGIGYSRKREVFGECVEFLDHLIEELEFLAQRGVAFIRERICEIDDHRTEASGNLDVRGSIETNLGKGEVDEVSPDRCAYDEAHLAMKFQAFINLQSAAARTSQKAVKLINRKDSRGWIVDCGRERLDCNIHQDPESEERVLFHGPFGPEDHTFAKDMIFNVRRLTVEKKQRFVPAHEIPYLRRAS